MQLGNWNLNASTTYLEKPAYLEVFVQHFEEVSLLSDRGYGKVSAHEGNS